MVGVRSTWEQIGRVGFGQVSEWLKETDCKSVGFAYTSSNLVLPIKKKRKPLHLQWFSLLFWLFVWLTGTPLDFIEHSAE